MLDPSAGHARLGKRRKFAGAHYGSMLWHRPNLRRFKEQAHRPGRDIVDYNWPGTVVADYLASSLNMGDMGIVTNPPYRLAFEFLGKALADGTQFIAFLLRLNFLESMKRKAFFELHPPSRVWISSRRFEMHSAMWDGPRVSSNVCYSWMIWDRRKAYYGPTIGWFDHREFA